MRHRLPQSHASQYAGTASGPLTAESLAGCDAVLIATAHGDIDYTHIVRHAPLVVDTRNACPAVTAELKQGKVSRPEWRGASRALRLYPMVQIPRPARFDLLVSAVVLVLTVLGLVVSPQPVEGTAILLGIGQSAPLVFRRHAPGIVLGVVLASTAAYFLLGHPFVTTAFAGLVVASYSVAAVATDLRARAALASTVVGVIALFAAAATLGRDVTVVDELIYVAIVALAWFLGDRAKTRATYTKALEQRAADLERTRSIEHAAAVAEERRRIARDLHDIVAHSVSTIVLHAGAAKSVLDKDPAGTRHSLDLIEDAGRGAIIDMRTILDALRTDEEDAEGSLRPQPSISGVARLIQVAREAGVAAELKIEGSELALPPSVEMSAYRIIQEAVTNLIRHAQAHHAEVVIRFDAQRLVLHITDDGRAPDATSDSGYGLVGMRERVALLGGTLRAGPLRDGGFEVLAVLPVRPEP